jgi:hypothetical protein
MNIKEIITKYLTENGYDGLCGKNCGCLVDDLCPCDEIMNECEPGYKVDSNPDDNEYGWEWVITTKKPDKGG